MLIFASLTPHPNHSTARNQVDELTRRLDKIETRLLTSDTSSSARVWSTLAPSVQIRRSRLPWIDTTRGAFARSWPASARDPAAPCDTPRSCSTPSSTSWSASCSKS